MITLVANKIGRQPARNIIPAFTGMFVGYHPAPRKMVLTLALLLLGAIPPKLGAGQQTLVSAREEGIQLSAGGNDDSVAPTLTPDGRFVLFSSAASDLVAGTGVVSGLNVYLRDRSNNTTALVSADRNGSGSGNSHSVPGAVSTNGRYVVFESLASNLMMNDTNGQQDVFVRDMSSASNRLVSVAMDGGSANAESSQPTMTPDGRYVVFISSAANLVPGDTNQIPDVFVRDLEMGLTILVSVGARLPGRRMASPVISPDGRYVAFFSDAAGLADAGTASSRGQVYIRDLVAGTTTWASADAGDIILPILGSASFPSYHPRLSSDGRYVVFKSGATTTTSNAVILRFDRNTANTTIISTKGIGSQADLDDDYGPEITPAGELVAFAQREGALDGDYSSVRVWNGMTNILVSDPGSGGVITNVAIKPVLSADGQSVAFLSNSGNVVTNPVSAGYHIYLSRLTDGSRHLVDADSNGAGLTDNRLSAFSLNADGRWVAFSSLDGSLVGADHNQTVNLFLRDWATNTTDIISRRDPMMEPRTPRAHSTHSQSALSADGRWAAFTSAADELVLGDTNGVKDVFLRDLATRSNVLVSVGYDGASATGGDSASPVANADGRYVVFLSRATNLVAGLANTNWNVFRRDLQTGTTLLISVCTNGASTANGDCSHPVVSQDGRYVTFLSTARNLATNTPPIPDAVRFPATFWRDVESGVTRHFMSPEVLLHPFVPSMSRDGRYVAYAIRSQSQTQVRVWDNQLATDVFTNNPALGAPVAALLSADGGRLLCKVSSGNLVRVFDVFSGANVLSFTSPVSIWNQAAWSADGRFLAYVATSNMISGTNLYLCDLETLAVHQVSSSRVPVGSNSGFTDSPALSADGRLVAYRSYVPDSISGSTNPAPNIYLYNRVLGTTSLLTDGQGAGSPVSWNSPPAISADGRTVAFLSLSARLVSGDLNRVEDAFAFEVEPPLDPTDSDGDGMPDWWMMHHFGHPTGQEVDLSRAQDDADGDGLSNLDEYRTGTVPRDPFSVFQVNMVSVIPFADNVMLKWASVPGKRYGVEYRHHLAVANWLPWAGFVWADGSHGYCLVPMSENVTFYRVHLAD